MNSVSHLSSRALRLKAGTADLHSHVDTSIMAKDPFASVQSYLQFLTLQYLFLKDVEALYTHPQLAEHLDDLNERRRLDALELDFADFDLCLPDIAVKPLITAKTDFATALGWLYVVEGSKVGAAMLGRQVQARLPVSGDKGARYLAGPGAGRGSAWRHLVQVIDDVVFSETQEQAILKGARSAFSRFQQYQAQVYA
ncbi:biliverdin-producing heme oxygenase [Bowmanella denitrificans]|uniref:biliverdin-producing heme oxygenase n=1 Tax=Bowmanella denitrificans TaxID=366582 RepID=UPI000C9B4172|nr:biliverdin-producing heme oxygenase [Bowmanella denitrificans]